VKHLRKNDPALAKIINRLGPYEFGWTTITTRRCWLDNFSQLGRAAARAILNRFKQIYDGKFPDRANTCTEEKHTSERIIAAKDPVYSTDGIERVENGVLDPEKIVLSPKRRSCERTG